MANRKRLPQAVILTGLLLLGLSLSVKAAPPAEKDYYNVKDYGARGDGTTLNSKAINAAIAAAAAAGGGTVYFPAGDYLTGSIHLQSNIALYISHGATIIAAPAKEDSLEYDDPEQSINDKYQDYGHSHFHNSLIWGEKLHD